MTAPSPDFDVAILGAGLAGASAARVLGARGLRVALVDPQPTCLPTFKAEKVEPDQADAFRRLGLMDAIAPHAARIHAVHEAHLGRVLRVIPIEQYGIAYQDMVNAVRRALPATVVPCVARAVDITLGDEVQLVALDSGRRLSARLVVQAAGTGGRLHEVLGARRRMVRAAHSMCSGFDVERTDGRPFPFDSLTYHADTFEDRVDYVTFFPIPGRTRVNLFSYHAPRDRWVRALADAPLSALRHAMPGLAHLTGDLRVTSKVECRPIDLYLAEISPRDGAVLVGDACQSVCPATGTGISKVLVDVERLCTTHVPAWLATPSMAAEKIAAFYADPLKIACDRASLESAQYRRQLATDASLRWWIHRQKTYAAMAVGGLRERLRGGSAGAATHV